MSTVRTFRDLDVYQNAMESAMTTFRLTAKFPAVERFSLVDQMRRSSRSVCANVAEAWRKRRYTAAFIAKLNDAEGEAAETQVWAEMAWRCGYIDERSFRQLDDAYDKIIGQLVRMVDQPEKWVVGSKRGPE